MRKRSCRRRGCLQLFPQMTFWGGTRRVPRFDGSSYCSLHCMEADVNEVLASRWRRFHTDGVGGVRRPKLGTILVQNGAISSRQLASALRAQQETGYGLIGEWLQKLGFLPEHHITIALSKQFGIPVLNIADVRASRGVVRMIPGKIARATSLRSSDSIGRTTGRRRSICRLISVFTIWTSSCAFPKSS